LDDSLSNWLSYNRSAGFYEKSIHVQNAMPKAYKPWHKVLAAIPFK
jgi:hypothetical protein